MHVCVRVIDAGKMAAAGVRHWLLSLNLPEQYEALLLAGGYDTLAKCEQLNNAVLEQIGIKPVGHRKRILLHLPRNATEPFTPAAYDSEDDDREIYDIPPRARKSGIALNRESTYTNIVEMNEIPKPVLPPKKRLSSVEEVDTRLGIISPVPFSPRLSQGVFGTSSCSSDTVGSKPKLCVVHPEKRPPVPARRVSKDGKAAFMNVENQLNNNVEGFEPDLMQKTSVSSAASPCVSSCTVLKQHDAVNEEDTVPVTSRKFSEPCVAAVSSISPFHRAESVDSAPKSSSRSDASSVDTVLKANKLNPGLEHELQELVSNAKKSAIRKVDSDVHSAGTSCSAAVSMHSVAVQSDNTIPVFSTSSNSDSCDRTVVAEESLTSTSMSTESSSLPSLKTSVAQGTGDGRENVTEETADMECVYIVNDESADTDSHLRQNQGPIAEDPRLISVREKSEPADELVYEGVCELGSGEQDGDQTDGAECRYSPPAFPPPPLPAGFAPYGVFEFSTYLEPAADNQERSSRPTASSMSGFADFAEERVKPTTPVKPQPAPRRRQSTADVVDDTALSPLAAGFSSALDDYLNRKETSPTDWLNQPSEFLSPARDVSDSQFGPFDDLRPPELLPETTEEDINATNWLLMQFDSDSGFLDPAAEESLLYESPQTARDVDDALLSPKAKNVRDDEPGIEKPLNADDFREATCTNEAGD